MAILFFSPIGNLEVYLASNGLPANGGFIYTYLAGTTTPAATFTSISGAVANTNPIVLTPAGLAPQPIWLTGGQAYKYIVTDALGNQIGPTEDNVRGIGDGSAGGGIVNPMTAVGDIIVGGAVVAGTATATRTGIGSTGQVLTVSGGVPVWAAASSAGNTAPAVNQQTGTSYHPVLADAPQSSCYQGIVEMNNSSANTITIDPHSTTAWVAGTTFQFVQTGTGQTSVAAGGGVTITNASSLNCRVQYSVLVLINVATDVWRLGGDMA